ncbi:hypothetical protein OVA07_00515 [Novosphingobium sp. SL115]|uniref:hypothetical protein n=1 Tax=Novosphingobium sp. SL115 TaxID=2995150 RepID=UPI00227421F6|nr:hypothetical protein [Novosphingobium sp. SL115]MCY1669496.1 hypothetical protein [Novosphingobium sp. SL115]
MPFLPEGEPDPGRTSVKGQPVRNAAVQAGHPGKARAPLGVDRKQEFRISGAGAQGKPVL